MRASSHANRETRSTVTPGVASDGASQRPIADEQGLLERPGQRDMQHHEEVRAGPQSERRGAMRRRDLAERRLLGAVAAAAPRCRPSRHGSGSLA
jgi:hypothetical protein